MLYDTPCNLGIVGQLGLHELLPGNGLLDGSGHPGRGLTDSGITLDFGSTSKSERLEFNNLFRQAV